MSNVINDATRVTHTTRTLLDPIAVTNQLNIYNAGVYNTPPHISDHFATYLYMNMDMQPSTPTKRRVWNYKKADFNKLNSLITNVNWSFISHGSLDEACELFTIVLQRNLGLYTVSKLHFNLTQIPLRVGVRLK